MCFLFLNEKELIKIFLPMFLEEYWQEYENKKL
jgi:hypothetical protein